MQTWNLTPAAKPILILTFKPRARAVYIGYLRRDAEPTQLYGVTVRIASLADVIRSKQATEIRPEDQRVLPTLREILARRSNPMMRGHELLGNWLITRYPIIRPAVTAVSQLAGDTPPMSASRRVLGAGQIAVVAWAPSRPLCGATRTAWVRSPSPVAA